MPTLARLGEISKGLSRNQISGMAGQMLLGEKARKLRQYGVPMDARMVDDELRGFAAERRADRRAMGVAARREIARMPKPLSQQDVRRINDFKTEATLRGQDLRAEEEGMIAAVGRARDSQRDLVRHLERQRRKQGRRRWLFGRD